MRLHLPALRTLAALPIAVLLIALLPGIALAHAQLDKASVPAGSAQQLTVRALSERPLDHNVEIEVLVPAAFTDVACGQKAMWTCAVEPADGGVVVHFTRTSGQDIIVEDTYPFSLVAAAEPGTYLFPTIQTYSSGEEVGWVNRDAEGEKPSPRLEVTAGGEATANEEEAPEHEAPGAEPEPEGQTAEQPPAEPAAQQPAPAQPAPAQPAPAQPAAKPAARPASSSTSTSPSSSGGAAAPASLSTATQATEAAFGDATFEDGTFEDGAFEDFTVGTPAPLATSPGIAVADEAAEEGGRGGLVVGATALTTLVGGGLVLARKRGLLGGDDATPSSPDTA